MLDGESKNLLERHVTTIAQKYLGDLNTEILLPPPPKEDARGPVSLGSVVYRDIEFPFGVSRSELLLGLGVYGRSGSGKTTIVFQLIKHLSKIGTPFLFLDMKRTARHLLPSLDQTVNVYTPGRGLSPLVFNPLVAPPGLERRAYISQLIDILGTAYTLGDGAKSILQQVFMDSFEDGKPHPTLKRVLEVLEDRKVHGREVGWKASALRALQSLTFVAFKDQAETDSSELVKRLLEESSVIELDGLDHKAQRFLVDVLMLWLFQYRLQVRSRERLKILIFVEEAHNFLFKQLQGRESVMSRMMRQCREIGIGMVVVDQHPHLLSSAALGNTFTNICLNIKGTSDVNVIAAMSLLGEDEKRYLNRLDLGYGIVKLQGKWHQPFLVRFREVEIDKGLVTDEALAHHMKKGRPLHAKTWKAELSRLGSKTGVLDSQHNFDAHRLLVDCNVNPCDGVRERYLRLGFGMNRGNKLKSWLLDHDFVSEARIAIGNTKRLILRPSKEGRKFLELDGFPLRDSIEHDFWKNFYAKKFRDAGYDVELEVSREGGRLDVLAKRGSEIVAVEIETGKSDFVRNVQNGLKSGFKLVVVATNEWARVKIERALGDRGLLAQEEVTVVLREEFEI